MVDDAQHMYRLQPHSGWHNAAFQIIHKQVSRGGRYAGDMTDRLDSKKHAVASRKLGQAG